MARRIPRDAITIILDVGPSMRKKNFSGISALDKAIESISFLIQRKIFSESKDELGLVLCGTVFTENLMNDENNDCYQHITVRELQLPSFEMINALVSTQAGESGIEADIMDGIIVGADTMFRSISGRHEKFSNAQILLFSDLASPFAVEDLDSVLDSFKREGIQFSYIGIPIRRDEDSEMKIAVSLTEHQQQGVSLINKICTSVNGDCYTFDDAVPAMSVFTRKQVRQTAWTNVSLSIGDSLKIPIRGYAKLKKPTQNIKWSSMASIVSKHAASQQPSHSSIQAETVPSSDIKDDKITDISEISKSESSAEKTFCTSNVETVRSYRLHEKPEVEVQGEEIIAGHRYGRSLVPFSKEDEKAAKLESVKSFEVLGFTASKYIDRGHFMGDSVMVIVGDERYAPTSIVSLSAFIHAMAETDTVAIVRRVYQANGNPKMGFLVPHIKEAYECLYYIELPFSEDIRQFTFPSLPISEDFINDVNEKYRPSEDQLACIDRLIDSCDLTAIPCSGDFEDETYEALKPRSTFDPCIQYKFQCFQERALNPGSSLPTLKSYLKNSLLPPKHFDKLKQKSIQGIDNEFKFTIVEHMWPPQHSTNEEIKAECVGVDAAEIEKRSTNESVDQESDASFKTAKSHLTT